MQPKPERVPSNHDNSPLAVSRRSCAQAMPLRSSQELLRPWSCGSSLLPLFLTIHHPSPCRRQDDVYKQVGRRAHGALSRGVLLPRQRSRGGDARVQGICVRFSPRKTLLHPNSVFRNPPRECSIVLMACGAPPMESPLLTLVATRTTPWTSPRFHSERLGSLLLGTPTPSEWSRFFVRKAFFLGWLSRRSATSLGLSPTSSSH